MEVTGRPRRSFERLAGARETCYQAGTVTGKSQAFVVKVEAGHSNLSAHSTDSIVAAAIGKGGHGAPPGWRIAWKEKTRPNWYSCKSECDVSMF